MAMRRSRPRPALDTSRSPAPVVPFERGGRPADTARDPRPHTELPDDIQRAFDEIYERHEADFRYLADR